jgi:hypothetical protein
MVGLSQGKRILRFLLACLCILLLAVLLSRGTTGGDEGAAIGFAQSLEAGHALSRIQAVNYLGHRLFWVIEKLLLNRFYSAVLPTALASNGVVHSALMVIDGSLFMCLCAVVGLRQLRTRGYDFAAASVATGAILISSSALSLFTGGFIECQMCFYVVLIVGALNAQSLTRSQFALLLAASAFLVLCKPYSFLFLLPLTFVIGDKRKRIAYAAIVTAVTGLWTLVVFLVGNSGSGTADLYENWVSVGSPGIFAIRLMRFFFSAPFGILWSFPLLGFAAIAWRTERRTLTIKLIATLLLSGFLAMFPFWHGAGGLAGPRYIVPFLLIFLPEVARGITIARRYWRWSSLLVPLLALFFLPTIDYRNTLFSRWAEASAAEFGWPYADPNMQPGIFAWRIVAARLRGDTSFEPSVELPYRVPIKNIFPMTGISRVIYLLDYKGWHPHSEQQSVDSWLVAHDMGNSSEWRILRALMIAVLLMWLCGVAFISAGTSNIRAPKD